MKKLLCLFLSLILMISTLFGSAFADECVSRDVPFYFVDKDSGLKLNLLFPQGDVNLPYLSISDAVMLTNYAAHYVMGARDSYVVKLIDFNTSELPGSFLLSVGDTGVCIVDCKNSTVDFVNYNEFFCLNYYNALLDDSSIYDVPTVTTATSSFNCNGDLLRIDFANDYHISFYLDQNGTGYLPLQTVSDLFLTDFNSLLLYGGYFVAMNPDLTVDEELPQFDGSNLSDLGRMYYQESPLTYSETLAEFNLNELCFLLDFHYGLKEEHDISGFESFFTRTGIGSKMMSPEPTNATNAMMDLFLGHLSDFHSGLESYSTFAYRSPKDFLNQNKSPLWGKSNHQTKLYKNARESSLSDDVPFYQEIDDTAFITFDHITAPSDYSDSVLPEDPEQIEDTIGQVLYAHQRICRDDSPIRNVVLDLSLCSGGNTGSGAFVIAWMLGAYTADYYDTTTHAKSSLTYIFDTNLDGRYNGYDDISTLNRYCLVSPCTFSCGNDIAAALASSQEVAMLGRNSGGGSCWSLNASTADGHIFSFSGRVRTNHVVNGSYYNIDQGVNVDFILSKPSSFYNREALTDYIRTLK